jgi:hypothetical protein
MDSAFVARRSALVSQLGPRTPCGEMQMWVGGSGTVMLSPPRLSMSRLYSAHRESARGHGILVLSAQRGFYPADCAATERAAGR